MAKCRVKIFFYFNNHDLIVLQHIDFRSGSHKYTFLAKEDKGLLNLMLRFAVLQVLECGVQEEIKLNLPCFLLLPSKPTM